MSQKIVKGIGKASFWTILFIIIQSLIGTGLMIYKINSDFEYACKLADILGPFYETNSNIITKSIETLKYSNVLFGDITIPTLGISGVIFFGIFVFVANNEKNKGKMTSSFPINSKEKIINYISLALIINIIVTVICEIMPQSWKELHGFATEIAMDGNILILILVTGILVPVMEEIIFRYGFITSITSNNKIAVYYSAITFGLLHGNPIQMIYATIIGIIFAKEDIKQNSVFPSMIMHIVINSSSVLAAKLFNNDIKGLLILSVSVFVILLIQKIKKLSPNKTFCIKSSI